MTAHTLVHERRRRRVASTSLFELGWPQFWLLSGVLGGILGIVALVFLAYLSAQ